MAALLTIRCDSCRTSHSWVQGLGSPAFGGIRKVLKEEGWHSRRPATGEALRDLCPTCWEAGER